MKPDRAFAADSPIGSYWLGHCTGFWLRGGRQSGEIEEIGLRADGRVASISVRRRGFVRNRLVVVPIEWIAAVDPWDEEVLLAPRRDRNSRLAGAPQLLPPAALGGTPAIGRPPLPPPHERTQDYPAPLGPVPPAIPAAAAYAALEPDVEPEPEERRRRLFGRRPAVEPEAPEIAAAAAFAAVGAERLLRDDETVEPEPVREDEPEIAAEAEPQPEPEEIAAVGVVAETEPEPVAEADDGEAPEEELGIAAAVAQPEPTEEEFVPAEPPASRGPSTAQRTATAGAAAAGAVAVAGRAGGRGAAGLAAAGMKRIAFVALLTLELAARGVQYGAAALAKLGRACQALAVAVVARTRARLPLVRRGAAAAAAAGVAAVALGTRAARRLAVLCATAGRALLVMLVSLAHRATSAGSHVDRGAGSTAARAGGASAAAAGEAGVTAAQATTKAVGATGKAGTTAGPALARGGAVAAHAAGKTGAKAGHATGALARMTGRVAVIVGLAIAAGGRAAAAALDHVGPLLAATFREARRVAAGTVHLAVAAVTKPAHWMGSRTGPAGGAWGRWRAGRRWQEGRPEPIAARRRPRRADIDLPPGVKLRTTPIEHASVGRPGAQRD